MSNPDLAPRMERRVEEMGYELVEMEQVGTPRRPILRLRIDRPESTPGSGVTVEDCSRVSRALEEWLDESGTLPATYVLEVSSPGVERPLVRPRDFQRFAGQEVALRGRAPLAGRARRLEGELIGLRGEGGEERVALRLPGGEEVEIPRGEITRAHLVYRWDQGGRSS
jgi:ribosome maturation factor RimP